MDKHNAVLDASFWINTHRSGLVDYLLDYFDLVVPTRVTHEIEYMPPDVDRLTPAGETFRRWRQAGRLKLKDPANPGGLVSPWRKRRHRIVPGARLRLADGRPGAVSPGKTPGAGAVASTDFVVLLYVDRRLSYDEAAAILTRSEAARHLKRAAMTALEFLAQQRREQNEDAIS